jgi:hypothetical protein
MRGCLAFLWLAACGGHATGGDPDAAPADAPAAALTRVLYVQLDGESITPGIDDPIHDVSSIAKQPATLSAFRANITADRATVIADVTSVLAPYNIDVVTARPGSGAYDMLVATDDLANAIDSAAPANLAALTLNGCGANLPPSEISFVFGATKTLSAHYVATVAIAMFAQDHGVPITAKAGDCLCYANKNCSDTGAACTLGANVPIDTGNWACAAGATTTDDGAEMTRVFGPKP